MERTIGPHRLAQHVGQSTPGVPAYAWLASSLERLISDGILAYDTRLPGERSAADALGLSRTTVAHAYEVLRERGFAEALQGSGTRVRIPGGPVTGGGEPLADPSGFSPGAVRPHLIDMQTAAPSAISGLHAAYQRALEQLGSYTQHGGYFRDGIPRLREMLAARYSRRGVPTTSDQILITTGALAGVAASVSALLSPGQRVLVESTGYPNTLAALRRAGARLTPTPDGERDTTGERYVDTAAHAGARAALLMPDFHNPTGHLMPPHQRTRIAEAWRTHGIIGIVDETLVDTWWEGPVSTPAMAHFATDCITVGSASKTIWGGLRIGWIRAPRTLIGAVASARLSMDLGAPVLEQLVTAELLGSPDADGFGGLDGTRRHSLRTGRDLLWNAISASCPGWEATLPSGGLCLWWSLPNMNSSAIVAQAAQRGLALTRGAPFSPDGRGMEGRLRTPFALDHDSLLRAARILAEVNSSLAS